MKPYFQGRLSIEHQDMLMALNNRHFHVVLRRYQDKGLIPAVKCLEALYQQERDKEVRYER